MHYKVTHTAVGIYKDKGSRFHGYLHPIANEEDAKELIHKYKKEYHDARHHCYAYIIGTQGEKTRSSDDGEPSNSAGRPILNQLQTNHLTNCMLVVVRYFGGTLLGVSGLINAYKNCAMDTIKNATLEEMIEKSTLVFTYPYTQTNNVMRIIKDMKVEILSLKPENNSTLQLQINKADQQQLVHKLQQINGGLFVEY